MSPCGRRPVPSRPIDNEEGTRHGPRHPAGSTSVKYTISYLWRFETEIFERLLSRGVNFHDCFGEE